MEGGRVAVILEQGTPLQMIQQLQTPWEDRFRVGIAASSPFFFKAVSLSNTWRVEAADPPAGRGGWSDICLTGEHDQAPTGTEISSKMNPLLAKTHSAV